MTAATERPGFKDKLKGWTFKGATLMAIGAAGLGLAGCGPSESSAEHTPPAATASQNPTPETTPSTSETTTPTPDETETPTAPEVAPSVTDIESSEVYQALSPEKQAEVKENLALSQEAFADLDVQERTEAAYVVFDANYDNTLDALVSEGEFAKKQAIDEGSTDKSLTEFDATKFRDFVTNLREQSVRVTPGEITGDNDDYIPYMNLLTQVTAEHMAASGDSQQLLLAKKLAIGMNANDASLFGEDVKGNVNQQLANLDTIATTPPTDDVWLSKRFGSLYPHIVTAYDPWVAKNADGWNDGNGIDYGIALGFDNPEPHTKAFQAIKVGDDVVWILSGQRDNWSAGVVGDQDN